MLYFLDKCDFLVIIVATFLLRYYQAFSLSNHQLKSPLLKKRQIDFPLRITLNSVAVQDMNINSPLQVVPKVPSTAWRWPPQWPFPNEFLSNITTFDRKNADSSSLDHLDKFMGYFISEESEILDIGIQSNYLTSGNIKFINISDFEVVNYSDKLYDYIIISSGIESILDPRNFFRRIWNILKPGGTCFIYFFSKPVEDVNISLSMWTTMNDEQKIWIAGSYFHYSVETGWEDIEGFDVFDANSTSKQMIFEKTSDDKAYMVQAKKIPFPKQNISDISKWIKSTLLSTGKFNFEDVEFFELRLSSMLSTSDDLLKMNQIAQKLSEISNVIQDLKEEIIPKSIQAMLSIMILEKWENTDDQKTLLRQGLGLDTSDNDFWLPVGKLTANISPREKIHLLADIMNSKNDFKLKNFPNLLGEIIDLISKLSNQISQSSIERLAVELLCQEYLLSNRNDADERLKKYILGLNSDKISQLCKMCDAKITYFSSSR